MSKEFTVATLGFEEHERRMLKSILQMRENRTPSFKPFVFKEGITPHIVIIDADKPDALEGWQAYRRTQGEKSARVSVVFLFKQEPVNKPKYHLCRPLITTQLLTLFEHVVAEEHGYAQSAPLANLAQPSAAPQEGMAALVVDDSLPVCIQMQTVLKKFASHVDFAETGAQACEFINSKRYNVIFVDVVLADMEGYGICQLIKRHPVNYKTPVIMLTSHSAPADRIKGKLAGCDTYLIKPVRQAVFEEVVREFLKTPYGNSRTRL
jgi:twitching motility two-component system response regulator PilG